MSRSRHPAAAVGRAAAGSRAAKPSQVAPSLALAVAATLGGVRGLPAQTEEELDAGTYEILQNGEMIGLERFVVRHDGTAVRAAARVTTNVESTAVIPGEVRLLLDDQFRPDRYELKPTEGPLGSVVGLRRGDRMRVQTESAEGERVKEFMAPSRLGVLEKGFAHHYFLLLRLVGEGSDRASVSLVVPSEGRQFRATVRHEGEESIPIGGESVVARRYVIEGGGEAHSVWTTPDGRVLRVEVPSSGWAARRRP